MKSFDRFILPKFLYSSWEGRIVSGFVIAVTCGLYCPGLAQSQVVSKNFSSISPIGKNGQGLELTQIIPKPSQLQNSGTNSSIGCVLIADYRNSYATPQGDTYESRFGSPRRPYYPYTQNNNQYPLRSNPQASTGYPQVQSATSGNYGLYSNENSKGSKANTGTINQKKPADWLSVPTNRPPPWTTNSSSSGSGQNRNSSKLNSTLSKQSSANNGLVKEESKNGPVVLSNTSGTINVEISHSDYLPSLPASLHKGSHFEGWSNTKIPKRRTRPGVEKFLIPKWLAGRWQRTKSTETKRVELPDGKALKTTGTTIAKTVDVFGTYIDAQGNIWQVFNPKRAVGEVDRGTAMDHHRVMKYKIEILGPKSVVVEVTASHLVVTKKKQQIIKSFQDEELNTYTLLANGKVKTESSVKVFDQLGKPILLTHSVSNVTKIQSAN